jgi:hypothetical protein
VDNLQRTYETTSECSIEFEVDGPYKVGCFCSATFIRFISIFFALSVCGQSHKTLQIPHIEIQTYQDFFFKVYKIFVFSLGGFDFTNSNQ